VVRALKIIKQGLDGKGFCFNIEWSEKASLILSGTMAEI
jgi:hypothetical protein